MATVHSTQESKTVPVIFQHHPDNPGGVLEYVTPTTAKIVKIVDSLSATQRQDVLRVAHAAQSGLFDYTVNEIESWTPEQRRAVIDSLPEVPA